MIISLFNFFSYSPSQKLTIYKMYGFFEIFEILLLDNQIFCFVNLPTDIKYSLASSISFVSPSLILLSIFFIFKIGSGKNSTYFHQKYAFLLIV